MTYLTLLLSPFNLLFFMIVAGFAIGKLRIKQISLGIAGILFASIFVGFLMNLWIPEAYAEIISNAQSTMKTFSKLGTSLFVSVIGLQTGFSIKNNSKGSMIAFAIGCLMSISGVIVMLLISVFDKTISYPSLLGILCGALTSTPGLSSTCELIGNGTEEAVWGYSCSYLPGVLLAVFWAQWLSRNKRGDVEKTPPSTLATKSCPELILISITALLGSILGNIGIPSLGSTAGMLTVGVLVGCAVKRKTAFFQISSRSLSVFKNLGLALFFTGTGFTTGIQSVSFNIKTIIYGTLIALTAILCGQFLCKPVFARYRPQSSFIIAGGMTSSPAYGAIVSQADELSANHFSFSYFGALISLIFSIQFLLT